MTRGCWPAPPTGRISGRPTPARTAVTGSAPARHAHAAQRAVERACHRVARGYREEGGRQDDVPAAAIATITATATAVAAMTSHEGDTAHEDDDAFPTSFGISIRGRRAGRGRRHAGSKTRHALRRRRGEGSASPSVPAANCTFQKNSGSKVCGSCRVVSEGARRGASGRPSEGHKINTVNDNENK